jgi:hypothetical protein
MTICKNSYVKLPEGTVSPYSYKLVYDPRENYRYITNKNHNYWSYKPS